MDELLPPEDSQPQLPPELRPPQPGFVGPETMLHRVLDLLKAHSNYVVGAGLFLCGNGTGYLAGRPHKHSAPVHVVQASVFPVSAPKPAPKAAPAHKPVSTAKKSAKASSSKTAKKPAAKSTTAKKTSKAKKATSDD
jgi:hypothetical protein